MLKSLSVFWKDKDDRRKLIGQLDRVDDGFEFHYLKGAREFEFRGLPEFPLTGDSFKRQQLFATFSSRLPSPMRPDFQSMIDSWGVSNSEDQLEVLAKSGGYSATDSMEFYEVRNDLSRELEFRIAAMTNARFDVPQDLKLGESLDLKPEPTNSHDEHATFVIVRGDTKIGYVPNSYSELIAERLKSGAVLRCSLVRKIEVPRDRPGWVAGVVEESQH